MQQAFNTAVQNKYVLFEEFNDWEGDIIYYAIPLVNNQEAIEKFRFALIDVDDHYVLQSDVFHTRELDVLSKFLNIQKLTGVFYVDDLIDELKDSEVCPLMQGGIKDFFVPTFAKQQGMTLREAREKLGKDKTDFSVRSIEHLMNNPPEMKYKIELEVDSYLFDRDLYPEGTSPEEALKMELEHLNNIENWADVLDQLEDGNYRFTGEIVYDSDCSGEVKNNGSDSVDSSTSSRTD